MINAINVRKIRNPTPFFHYKRAKQIWKLSSVKCDGLGSKTDSVKEWWEELGEARKNKTLQETINLTTFILTNIWKARRVAL